MYGEKSKVKHQKEMNKFVSKSDKKAQYTDAQIKNRK